MHHGIIAKNRMGLKWIGYAYSYTVPLAYIVRLRESVRVWTVSVGYADRK